MAKEIRPLRKDSILSSRSRRAIPSMEAEVTTALYHRDIGIPASLPQPAPGTRLGYTNHAVDAAAQDGLPRGYLPATLPAVFDLIEVEALGDQPVKWVVRFPLPDLSGWDIVLAVSWDGVVRTVWFNRSDDMHRTLDRSRYERGQ